MNQYRVLSIAALLAFFCSSNSFAEILTVDAGGPVAPDATGVSVDINIDNGDKTAGASFTVTYDAAKLVYKGVSSSFFGTFAAQGITPSSVTIGTGADEKIYTQGLVDNPSSGAVMLAAAQVTNGAAGPGTLFTLTFDVITGATGDAVIGITESTITNEAAGYASPTQLPMLVGVSGSDYPTVPVTAKISDTLNIGGGIVDTDNDGIDDDWEINNFGNLTTATAISDFDKDGYTDKQEYLNGGNYDPKVVNTPGGPGYINLLADSLIINFPSFGLYTYNSISAFTSINSVGADLSVAVDIDSDGTDEIVSYFPAYGLYVWDNGVWSSNPIAAAQPEAMIKLDNRLVIDFGVFGLYTFSAAENFTHLTPLSPTVMTEVDLDSDGIAELAAYLPDHGLYIWDGVWSSGPIAIAQPEAMIKLDNKLTIDFGQYGLYTYNTAENFTKLTSLNPTVMTEADLDADGVAELAAYFPDYGIYIWDNGVWGDSPIAIAQPEAMIRLGNKLAIDFGQYGLYTYNIAENFTNLTSLNPTVMTEADLDSDGVLELAAYFPEYGIYIWDTGVWGSAPITSAPADMITCGNIVE